MAWSFCNRLYIVEMQIPWRSDNGIFLKTVCWRPQAKLLRCRTCYVRPPYPKTKTILESCHFFVNLPLPSSSELGVPILLLGGHHALASLSHRPRPSNHKFCIPPVPWADCIFRPLSPPYTLHHFLFCGHTWASPRGIREHGFRLLSYHPLERSQKTEVWVWAVQRQRCED